MADFYLMRHAEADYRSPIEKKTHGWGMDLAPLSAKGRDQAKAAVAEVQRIDPEFVLVSPATRSMETAMHVLRDLDVEFRVEFDLHEWVPCWKFSWTGFEDVLRIQSIFESQGGEYLNGERQDWESLSCIRERVGRVFDRYKNYDRVLVICHGMVMRAITGKRDIENTEIIPYQPKR